MPNYWMNLDGETSQAGPHGEPMVDAICDENGMAREFTEYQVECFQKIGLIPETIYLNDEDYDFFIDLIENPPEYNEKFKELLEKYGN